MILHYEEMKKSATHSICVVKTKEIIPLLETETLIGRGADNTISLQNNFIARYHASIQRMEGEFYLIDKNSANGTSLNGIKVEPLVPVKLSNNDRILLAGTEELVFLENSL